jgi:hypothetical protein
MFDSKLVKDGSKKSTRFIALNMWHTNLYYSNAKILERKYNWYVFWQIDAFIMKPDEWLDTRLRTWAKSQRQETSLKLLFVSRGQFHQHVFKTFFWCAPFGYLYFLSFSLDDLTRIGCRNLSWYGFETILNYGIGWDLNPRPFDRELRSITIRPDFQFHPLLWGNL